MIRSTLLYIHKQEILSEGCLNCEISTSFVSSTEGLFFQELAANTTFTIRHNMIDKNGLYTKYISVSIYFYFRDDGIRPF